MSRLTHLLRASLCAVMLASVCWAHAAPGGDASKPADEAGALRTNVDTKTDLDSFLVDSGLLAKVNQASADIVLRAMSFLGLPYKRGGDSFETGFDCSGFVKALYEQSLGKILPRSAAQQAAQTTKIDNLDLQPGDLVFFNTMRRAFSHVGIYIGDGNFIHSPKPGAEVRIENIHTSYWNKRFNGARRVESDATQSQLSSATAIGN